jgi:hypothetical protein
MKFWQLALILVLIAPSPAVAGCFLFICSPRMHVSHRYHVLRHYHRTPQRVVIYKIIVVKPAPQRKIIYW